MSTMRVYDNSSGLDLGAVGDKGPANETYSSPTYPDCSLFNFVLWGVIGATLCMFGCIGNSLSFTAFQRDKRTPATLLLQCLACSDFVLLMGVFVVDSIPYACSYSTHCENFWSTWPYIRYVWILTPIAHMCSIFFVVLVALNRYWAVCRPHNMNRVWSVERTIKYIFAVLFIVVSFNVPRFFEYRMVLKPDWDDNTTFNIREERTEFGTSFYYKEVYKSYLVNILLVVFPLATLMFLTFRIIRSLRARKKNMDAKNSNKTSIISRASQEITFVLTVVLVVAIVCQTPLAIFHFIRNRHNSSCGTFVFYLDNISKIFININSCVNFIIYTLFSSRFRRLLVATLLCQRGAIQVEPYTSTRREYTMASLKEDDK